MTIHSLFQSEVAELAVEFSHVMDTFRRHIVTTTTSSVQLRLSFTFNQKNVLVICPSLTPRGVQRGYISGDHSVCCDILLIQLLQ